MSQMIPEYQGASASNETFRMLAEVLETGDTARYRPRRAPNTHWSNWPEAGTF